MTAVLILGHGSPVVEANETLREIALGVKKKGGYEIVQPAFLQFEHPNFAEAVNILVQQGVRKIIVHPYFLYMGSHVTKDLPFEIETAKKKYPNLDVILAPHLGYHEKLVEVAVERIEAGKGQGSRVKGQKEQWLGSGVWGQRKNKSAPCPLPLAPVFQHPIEVESFRLIGEQLDESRFDARELPIIKRLIHTTADFEYADLVRFGNGAITAGIDAISKGADIITDVRMAEVGISRERLSQFGGTVKCFVADEDVAEYAKKHNMTKTAAAMRKAFECGLRNAEFGVKENPPIPPLAKGGKGGFSGEIAAPPIVVIGNAPTALRELIKIIRAGQAQSALVIGVPVGFVDAEESKEELMKLDIPYIAIKGKKGGSTVAVAIVNALLIMAEEKLQVAG